MKKVIVLVLVALLSIATVALACNRPPANVHYCPASVQETVAWSILPWLSLSIHNDFTDLGNLTCLTSKNYVHGNYLTLRGNVDWQVTATISGRIDGHCANYYLSVSLNPSQGTASQLCNDGKQIWIDYHLRNLECLRPGNYTAVVVYTATAR